MTAGVDRLSAPVSDIAPTGPSLFRRVLADPGAAVSAALALVFVCAGVFAPLIAWVDPYETNLAATLRPPGAEHWFGTDAQGRDLVVRCLYGLRLTLLIGLVSVAFGGGVGIAVGFLAAFYPRLDGVLMRLMDMLLSFPAILFGLALAAIFGPGVVAVVTALSITTVPLMARIVRGAALVVMKQDYIKAARAIGMSDARLIWRHVAPNAASAIFVFATLRFGQVILLGSALSFLGLGAQPPTAELGAMAPRGATSSSSRPTSPWCRA